MKKLIATIGLLACVYTTAIACDVCGCAANGGGTMGIMPRFGRHFVGVRYSQSAFTSQHLTLFENEIPQHSSEQFNTIQVWGRYVPHPRVQVFALMPYHFFSRKEENRTTTSQGWGDATLLANYVVINSADSMSSKFKHALQLGAGVKLPTGNYNRTNNGALLLANMQMGSGTVDIPFNAMYTLRYKKAGVNTELNYTLNTTNTNSYRFGNRAGATLRFFYWKNIKNATFLPQLGVSYEHLAKDVSYKEIQKYTGGQRTDIVAGLDTYFKSFSFGVALKQPISYHLGSGQITPKTSFSTSIIYLF